MVQSALNVHLNIEEKVEVNTPSLFYSLEKLLPSSLENKYILHYPNIWLHLPVTMNLSCSEHVPMLIRVRDSVEQHVQKASLRSLVDRPAVSRLWNCASVEQHRNFDLIVVDTLGSRRE